MHAGVETYMYRQRRSNVSRNTKKLAVIPTKRLGIIFSGHELRVEAWHRSHDNVRELAACCVSIKHTRIVSPECKNSYNVISFYEHLFVGTSIRALWIMHYGYTLKFTYNSLLRANEPKQLC